MQREASVSQQEEVKMEDNNFSPKYAYDNPMFMITVSVVVIDENGVKLVLDPIAGFKDKDVYKFPSGTVKAGQESIQFAAVRHVKEQLGVIIKKDSLIPVDFRSEPERSESGNIVDIGFVTLLGNSKSEKGKWFEVDFEEKEILFNEQGFLYHQESITFFKRALDVILMMKNG